MRREKRMRQLHELLTLKLQMRGLPRLDETMRLREDLRIDSIMLLQLFVLIEEELRLAVPEDELDPAAFATVGSLLDFLERLKPLDAGTDSEVGA